MNAKTLTATGISLLVMTTIVSALPVAFPGAEGAGRFAVGGRGGSVYEVTHLGNSGPGSIVDALSAGGRTVVFRVSGTIELGDVILQPKSYTTIAGQSAPGDGICLKGRIHIKNNAHDIIIRYLRVRVDEGGANSSGDAIDIESGHHIIIDHVSASYARDETISCQDGSDNVTVQWCIMSEALTYESHSYGSLIRGQYGERKSYHHNLYAHNRGRNPRPGNYRDMSIDPDGLYFDFRNNVVYNWSGGHPGYNADKTTISRYNFVGNVFIRGIESSGDKAFKEDAKYAYAYWAGNAHGAAYSSISVPADQWSLVTFNGFNTAEIAAYKARSYEIPMEPVTTTSAAQALQDVLADAGVSFPVRDAVDQRIVSDVINRTGHSIENTDDLATPWPTLYSLAAPADGDHDGMPDAWELANGLDPANAADRNYYTLHAEYTNLEVYLNSLIQGDVEPPAAPTGLWAAIDNGSVSLDWLDNTETDFDVYNLYRSTTPGSGYTLLSETGLAESAFIDNTALSGQTYYYVVTAEDIYANESAPSVEIAVTLSPAGMGKILREWWTGIAGASVSDLTSSAAYPDDPSGRDLLAALEGPRNWADACGTRVRGYLHPPVSGSYVFAVASDNDSQLWLSADGAPENAVLIASVSGATEPRQWDKYSSQQSAAVFLEAGRKYYLEVLHKEETGDDHWAVAWSGPGIAQQVIPGRCLSPWFVGLYGDANADDRVDLADLPDFIALWLESDCADGSAWDLNGDCVIDLYEFAALACNWMADNVLPAPPANLSATRGDGVVTLDWDDNTEADLAGYHVYRSTTSGGGYVKIGPAILETPGYADNSVSNGTAYYYVITAVDKASNESDFSEECSATPNPTTASVTLQENETGVCPSGGEWIIETEHAGYTGSGYINTDNAAGTGINYRIEVFAGQTHAFVWRFANGGSSRSANLIIDGQTVASGIAFPATGAWTAWSTTTPVNVTLPAAVHTVRLEATGGDGLANVDYMQVSGADLTAANCP